MNICLIIDDYLPDSIKVGAKMMHELAVEFVSRGYSVTVITPVPSLLTPSEITVLDGVTVYRFKSGEIKNVSKVKRAINETLLSFYAWRAFKAYFKSYPQDLIVYYSPSIFWGGLVKRLKKLWGAKSYLIVRDFFPQWVIDNGMLSATSPITRYFRFFEALSYGAADVIGIQSPKNLAWFSETTSVKKPLDLLYNWAANEPAPATSNAYRTALGLQDKVVYFYGGNIGHAQDMMNIVRLAITMRSYHNAHFVLVGAGDEVELVRTAIAEHNLLNMSLLPPVSQVEFKYMLAEFDIGLFSLHHDHTTHNFPGKLLGYMVQNKPILGSVNPDNDLQEVIEQSNSGFVTVNGNDEALLANAVKLLNDESLRTRMGSNAKQLLEDVFSVQAAANGILKASGY
jgi:glycosyltransferase involved in cell wall biosynthesis